MQAGAEILQPHDRRYRIRSIERAEQGQGIGLNSANSLRIELRGHIERL